MNHLHTLRRFFHVRWAPLLLVLVLYPQGAFALDAPDECVKCHSDPRFLVRNKKLYDYFQDWKLSIHSQEGITCAACHGGNPKAGSKEKAHKGKALRAADAKSPLNYGNIPATCAKCHANIYAKYRESLHFEHLQDHKGEAQGPNCVTCHGSVSTTVLTVTSVRQTCSKCHNSETGNAPEIPARAERVLNTFLSIHRYIRFITLRADPEDARSFFRVMDPLIEKLNADWHSFDIENIARQTRDILRLLKVKRTDIKRVEKERKAKQ